MVLLVLTTECFVSVVYYKMFENKMLPECEDKACSSVFINEFNSKIIPQKCSECNPGHAAPGDPSLFGL